MYPRQQRMKRADDDEKQCLRDQNVVVAAELAPLNDSMLKDTRDAVAAREDELAARTYELDAKEARLEAAAAAGDNSAVRAAQWAALAAERQALAGRWMCLAEDKKALAAAERRALRDSGGGSGNDPQPFEPGSLPIQDVRCAVIAHQVDIPCSSCCFQR